MMSILLLLVSAAAAATAATATSGGCALPGKGGPTDGGAVWVAPAGGGGDDGAAGSLAAPLATLHEAQVRLRAILAARRAAGVPSSSSCPPPTVWLLPGTHRLAATLALGDEDSGGAWRAAGPGTVVSGGVPVTGWTPSDPANASSPLTAPWPAAAAAAGARALFVAGDRAAVTVDDPAVWGLGPNSSAIVTATGYITPSAAPRGWPVPASGGAPPPAGAPVVEVVWSHSFTQPRCAVAAVTPLPNGSTAVDLAQPCLSFGASLNQVGGLPSTVVNGAPPAALAAGAWALTSPAAAAAAYAPRSASERAGLLAGTVAAVAPVLPVLLAVHGAAGPVAWSGVTFAEGGWAGPDGPGAASPAAGVGFLERYGNVMFMPCAAAPDATCFTGPDAGAAGCPVPCALVMAPSAVRVTASAGVTFSACAFTRLGGNALGLFNGTVDSGVYESEFDDITGGAVIIGNVNETQATDPGSPTARVAVADSVFTRLGAVFQGATGIFLFAALNATIAHNRLTSTPYTAMSFGWPVPQGSTFSGGNALVGNDASDVCTWGEDGGAVHTIGVSAGPHTIAGNFFHNQTRGRAAVYIDNTSRFFNTTGNVVDVAPMWLYLQQSCGPGNNCGNAGRNDTATGNFVRNAPDSPFPYDNNNNSVAGTVYVAPGGDWPPAAEGIIAAAGPRPGTAHHRPRPRG
jgi:hypothetical protein